VLFVDSNTSACKIPFLNTKKTLTHCKSKFNKTPPKFNNQENQQTNKKVIAVCFGDHIYSVELWGCNFFLPMLLLLLIVGLN